MAVTKINGARQIEAASITNSVQNFGTPIAATDVAIKSYVDSVAQGLDTKTSSRLATTAALPANIYANGASGVGATLTGSALGVLTVDGVATLLNDIILVKNEIAGLKNGLYRVTTEGTAAVAYILTRTTDMDLATEFSGGYSFVESGATLATTGWVCSNSPAPVVGTTAITFQQFSGAGTFVSGNGITVTGMSIAINTLVTADLLTAQTLSNKTFVAPVLGTPTSGTLTNCVFPVLNQNTTGFSSALKSATTTVDVSAATAPTVGQVLTAVNGTTATWQAIPASTVYQRSTAVTGTQDSANKIFAIANAVSAGSEQVFINGQLLAPGATNDYVISGTTVTFQAGFTAPSATDVLRVYGNY